ncbi:MAG: hypothetical protein ACXV8K_05630, partial [Ilumatobacteraceae bacterium]
MDQLEETAAHDAPDDDDDTVKLPWWQSKLNLAVVAMAIARPATSRPVSGRSSGTTGRRSSLPAAD